MPILDYTPNVIEPVEHPRAKEARQKGMTAEQLLSIEKANAESLKNQEGN